MNDKIVNKTIGNFLNGELKKRGITHAALSTRLKEEGLRYSASSITTKLSRGTFSATFFMQCLIAIGYESINIAEIKKLIKK